MHRPALVSLASILILSGLVVAAPRSHYNSRNPTARLYARHTFGAHAMAGAAGSAGVAHLRHSPREWGQGGSGFAKRFGSAMGTHAVNNGIRFGVSKARHEEFGYRPSGKHGFGPRMKYALTST